MPECQNCGAFVTPQYVKVFTPDDVEEPRACPRCPDLVRDNGKIREAKSGRSNARAVDE